MLKRLRGSISVILTGSYLLLATLALVVGLVGYLQIGNINDILVHETTERAEIRYLSTKVRVKSLQISSLVKSYVTTSSDTEKDRLETQFEDESLILNELVRQLGTYVSSSDKEWTVLSEITTLLQLHLDQGEAVMSAYDGEGRIGSHTQTAMDTFEATRAQLVEQLAAFEDQETTLLYASQRVAGETVKQARATTIALSAIALVGGVFFGVGGAWIIVRPLGRLVQATQRITAGNLERLAEVRGWGEVGVLAQAFNEMTLRLRELIGRLEERVADRTRDLATAMTDLEARSAELEEAVRQSQRRATLLQASAEVSRAIAQIRDLAPLLTQVTHFISEYFGFYHAGIFLIDDTGLNAVLRAANSEGGQRMLARGHKLGVGTTGIVGFVTGAGQPRIALDVGADVVYFDNPDLPETRSEMAVPLRIGGQVVGALDVQSTEPAAFGEEDVAVLSTLADQIAIAIENANLLQQTQAALQEAETGHRRYLRQEWDSFLGRRPAPLLPQTLGGGRDS